MKQNKNTDKYFKCDDWTEEGVKLYCFTSQRSIGKSTDIIKRGVRIYKETGKAFIILRNTDAEVKTYTSSGNNIKFWENEYGYIMKGRNIYHIDEDGNKNLVVLCLALSNWYLIASGNFDNFSFIFFEEFGKRNDRHSINVDDYKNFGELLQTIERDKPDFEVWMATNYIEGIQYFNHFFVKWGIRPGVKCTEILDGTGRFYQLDSTDYNPMKHEKNNTISSAFAKYDKDYERSSISGGFMPDKKYHIVYPTEVSNYKYIRTFIISDRFIDLGTAKINGVTCYLFRQHNKKNKNIVEVTTTHEDSMKYGVVKMDEETMLATAKEIIRLLLMNKVWFTTVQIDQIISKFAFTIVGKYRDI